MKTICRKFAVLQVEMRQSGNVIGISSFVKVIRAEKIVFQSGRKHQRISSAVDIGADTGFHICHIVPVIFFMRAQSFGDYGYKKQRTFAFDVAHVELGHRIIFPVFELVQLKPRIVGQLHATQRYRQVFRAANDPPECGMVGRIGSQLRRYLDFFTEGDTECVVNSAWRAGFAHFIRCPWGKPVIMSHSVSEKKFHIY